MKKKNDKPASSLSLHIRMQVVGAEKVALGPGKADLLELIEETGSLSEAAKRMEMSYMKAWTLAQTMKPFVQFTRGGHQRGGAKLTTAGKQALELYRRMGKNGLKAIQADWRAFQCLLAD